MAKLTKQEMKHGEKVIGGPKIYFWVISVLVGIGTFSLSDIASWGRNIYIGPVGLRFPQVIPSFGDNTPLLFLALFVMALVGLYVRKGWAVPLGRAALIVSMVVFFPVGTIFGAILWKRFNDPAAKKYLNYGARDEEDKETEDNEVEETK